MRTLKLKSQKVKLTEAQFQSQVLKLARMYGWHNYHTFFSYRSQPGYPDLHLWHPVKKLSFYAELKNEIGKLSEKQVEVIESMREAGLLVYVWRPSDFEDIQRILKGDK